LLDAWRHEYYDILYVTNTITTNTVERSSLTRSDSTDTRQQHKLLSYPELAYRALGARGETMVKAGIALMQSGVCLTYLIFVPQNLHGSLLYLFGWNVRATTWLLVMVAVQIPLSFIRDIRKLTPTNLLANVLILYGLVTCLVLSARESGKGPGGDAGEHWMAHFHAMSPFKEDWFLFVGTSVSLILSRGKFLKFELRILLKRAHQSFQITQVLLFEGSITLLVPLQEAVHTEERRARFPALYQRVILSIICFYAIFGVMCWMAFGPNVRTVLTTSLPSGIVRILRF
jgi:proton-coupled amino acid transporter